MIKPPGSTGVAFSEASDGDLRASPSARKEASEKLGIAIDWASLAQVHGDNVLRVTSAGLAGEADAAWTTERNLPLAVFTADCFGVVVQAPDAVGVAHVGWRGADKRTLIELTNQMTEAGHAPAHIYAGPGIGPCCFEVGTDVASLFQGFVTETSWGTTSVDLRSVVRAQAETVMTPWELPECTYHDARWFSHRRDGDRRRMAAIGWLP